MAAEFQSEADRLYREKVLRARRTPPEQRLLQGGELFDYACETMLAGLRMQMPGATEAELMKALGRRLEIGRRLERQSENVNRNFAPG